MKAITQCCAVFWGGKNIVILERATQAAGRDTWMNDVVLHTAFIDFGLGWLKK